MARMRFEYVVRFYYQLIARIADYNNTLINNLIGILNELKVVLRKILISLPELKRRPLTA